MMAWSPSLNGKSSAPMAFFIRTALALLGRPRMFFSEFPAGIGMWQTLGFLTACGVFFSIARVLQIEAGDYLLTGGIHLFNAVGMAFILSAAAYGVMRLMTGKQVRYSKLFGIYALSSGITLLVSWIPAFVILTEPWKWWLIGTGMTRCCGLRLREAWLVILLSVSIWILFYWTLIPIINR